MTVEAALITHISSLKLYCPNDLRPNDARRTVMKGIKEAKRRYENIPLLNPINDMKITELEFVDLVSRIEKLEKRMFEHPMHKSPLLKTEYVKYEEKVVVQEELSAATQKLQEAKSVLQLDELKCRKRVLRRMGYCTSADVIELKGRVACELSR